MAKILIVDDSVTVRRILRRFFHEKTDHTVVAEASNGSEAISKYRKYLPDLVTMDLIMPEINGLESARKIIAKYPDAKIIVISSINKKEMVVTALKSGAKGYVLKPIDEDKLLKEVERVLSL